MIIPYGHEGVKVRGLPWVTIVIFVLCCAVFLITAGAVGRAAEKSEEYFSEAAETYLAQPTLDLDPEFEELLLQSLGIDENQREVFLESLSEEAVATGSGATQERLDGLVERFWSAYRGSPHYRFGVVPVSMSPINLMTYQFLHGGWGHLLGNLLFLYLAAPHIEQRWGRPVFLGFYLTAGAVSALFWAFRYPELDLPLVGASGSIAGVMGAFLICFGTSKIRFFYWFGIVWGTFQAPAWLMLPLWLVMEVISGRTMDVMGEGLGGVAHWAHVWGFIFGMGFAFVLGMLGLDERLAEKSREAPGSGIRRARDHAVRNPDRTPVAQVQPEARPPARPPEPRVAPPDTQLGGSEDPPVLELVESSESPVKLRTAERLRLVEAIPRTVGEGILTFEVGQQSRRLALAQVEGVAVGAIVGQTRRPFLVIDLLLDPPTDGTRDLRVLRFQSSTFDPRRMVGGEDAMTAFVALSRGLLAASGAIPLPDAATLDDPTSTAYRSIEDYQQRVLGIMG